MEYINTYQNIFQIKIENLLITLLVFELLNKLFVTQFLTRFEKCVESLGKVITWRVCRMKLLLGKFVFIVILVSQSVLATSATSLRGKVVSYNSYYNSYYPAAGIQIVIVKWKHKKWIPVANVTTQRDGMYYLNLSPGNYYLHAPGIEKPLTVNNVQSQDLPQIKLIN